MNQTGDIVTSVVPRISDPFLFYSIDENLQNAMNLQPVDYRNDGSKSSTPIVRKTRISFEKDLLSLMADVLWDYFDMCIEKSQSDKNDIQSWEVLFPICVVAWKSHWENKIKFMCDGGDELSIK